MGIPKNDISARKRRKTQTFIRASSQDSRGIPFVITGYLLWKRIKVTFKLYSWKDE
jgi:hypothetical protein